MRDSDKVIGRKSADGTRLWRDDFTGHVFKDGRGNVEKIIGPHLNVEAPHLPNGGKGLHLFY